MSASARRALPPRPGALSKLEFVRCLTPYVFLEDLAAGRRVLEVGVGSGHGAWMLRGAGAKSVVAADIDAARLRTAGRLCGTSGRVGGVAADAQNLPFRPGTFDLVTCFEVVEHVRDRERLLEGLGRVLSPGAVALVSTPNRRLRLLPFQRPWNPEHVTEYRRGAFERALRRHFPSHALLCIYGDPPSQGYYARIWKQQPLRVYARMLRGLIVAGIPPTWRDRLRGLRRPSPARSAAAGVSPPDATEVVVPDRRSWPFWVGRSRSGTPMNFVAICGAPDAVRGVLEGLGIDGSPGGRRAAVRVGRDAYQDLAANPGGEASRGFTHSDS